MPARGTSRRDFQAARHVLKIPGDRGSIDVGVTEDGQVKVTITGAYQLQSMYRGSQQTEVTTAILVPEPPKPRRRR